MGELTQDSDNGYPDLLEKQEKRKHEYLQEDHPGADSGREGEPHRIIADVAEKEKQTVETGSESAPEPRDEESEDEVEIHYEVDDGSEVRTGPPEEAIKETSDLDSVKQLLEDKGLLDEYRELLSQQGDFVFDPGEDQGEAEDDLVSNQGENATKETDSCSDETKDKDPDSEEREIYMRNGEVVV